MLDRRCDYGELLVVLAFSEAAVCLLSTAGGVVAISFSVPSAPEGHRAPPWPRRRAATGHFGGGTARSAAGPVREHTCFAVEPFAGDDRRAPVHQPWTLIAAIESRWVSPGGDPAPIGL